MKGIFSGTFEQVEEAISEDFARNIYTSIKKTNFFVNMIGFFFFIGLGVYAVYGFGWYMTHFSKELIHPINVHNEFRFFFFTMWQVHFMVLFYIVSVIVMFKYKNKHRMKAYYFGRAINSFFMLFWSFHMFVVTELFINSFALRMFYLVLFIILFFYVLFQSYRNAEKLVYGAIRQMKLYAWAEKNKAKIISFLFSIGGLYYLSKVIFQDIGDFETRLMGALVDFLPLMPFAMLLIMLHFYQTIIKSYYLTKYSEQFRKKFGVDKVDWYGKNYKDEQMNYKNINNN